MPKVGKHIFSEVEIVLHQMQCSETQFFVVYFSVTREPNVHRIQRITQLSALHDSGLSIPDSRFTDSLQLSRSRLHFEGSGSSFILYIIILF